MTLFAILYMIPALVGMFWPAVTLLFKKHVMRVQGLAMGTLTTISMCMLLYSTFFNTFLVHEHLLCFLYSAISVMAPPMFYVTLCCLSNVGGVTRKSRQVFWLAFVVDLALFIIGNLNGRAGYQKFLDIAVQGGDLSLIPGEWKYNLMIIIGYWCFIVTLGAEIVLCCIFGFGKLRKYHQLLDEYYAEGKTRVKSRRIIYFCLVVILVIVTILVLRPLHHMKSVPTVITISVLESIVMFYLGYYFYTLPFSAEMLAQQLHKSDIMGRNYIKVESEEPSAARRMKVLETRLKNYIETEHGFLETNISVFSLSDQFHVSQQTIMRSLRESTGYSFMEYINGLRIEYAINDVLISTNLAAGETFYEKMQEEGAREKLAARCGFTSPHAFEDAFYQVMSVSFDRWLKEK